MNIHALSGDKEVDEVGSTRHEYDDCDQNLSSKDEVKENTSPKVRYVPAIKVENWDLALRQAHLRHLQRQDTVRSQISSSVASQASASEGYQALLSEDELEEYENDISVYAIDDESFPDLPSNAPVSGHPHLLACTYSKWSESEKILNNMAGFSFADALVTILYNHGKPTLQAFLDYRKYQCFLFERNVKDGEPIRNNLRMKILRINKQVLVRASKPRQDRTHVDLEQCGPYRPASKRPSRFEWHPLVSYLLPERPREPWRRTESLHFSIQPRYIPETKYTDGLRPVAALPSNVDLRLCAAQFLVEEVWKVVPGVCNVTVAYE
jgi:hypothetical protein